MFFNFHKIDNAGNLQEDGIKFLLKEVPLPDYQRNVADSVVTTCVAKVNEAGLQKREALKAYSKCALHEIIKACPKDMQDMSDRCIDMRAGKENPNKSG